MTCWEPKSNLGNPLSNTVGTEQELGKKINWRILFLERKIE
jgi:hypothetical protein